MIYATEEITYLNKFELCNRHEASPSGKQDTTESDTVKKEKSPPSLHRLMRIQ